jgi:glycosyltransferase involved in cell wall biosynthesis
VVDRGAGWDALVFLGNPYWPSTWVSTVVASSGAPVFHWTHGWHGREGALQSHLRAALFRRATEVWTYGDVAAAKATSLGIQSHSIYNSHPDWNRSGGYVRDDVMDQGAFVSRFLLVSRLIPERNVELLIDAARQADPSFQFTVAGSGPRLQEFQSEAPGNVQFLGQIDGRAELDELFLSHDAFVIPGKVGVAALQAIGWGLPVVAVRDAPHAPEFEALTEFNSVISTEATVSSLNQALGEVSQRRWVRSDVRESISSKWTPKQQAARIEARVTAWLEQP